ncbi:hypothetical protein D3C81_2122600 [compost metagenome]
MSNEGVRKIPVEDDEGNLHIIEISRVESFIRENPDDSRSLKLYCMDNGKVYKEIHSEKGIEAFHKWTEKLLSGPTASEGNGL